MKAKRRLVAWSGGLDSTVMLHRLLMRNAGGDVPVVAVSIDHPQISYNMTSQKEAQQKYLELAKGMGLHPDHYVINWSVGHPALMWCQTTFEVQPSGYQWVLWMASIGPYLKDGDRVHLGYIQTDGVWSDRARLEATFDAFAGSRSLDAKLKFDLGGWTKADVLQEAKRFGIPESCHWSCDADDRDEGPHPCGKCKKCEELARGQRDLAAREVTVDVKLDAVRAAESIPIKVPSISPPAI